MSLMRHRSRCGRAWTSRRRALCTQSAAADEAQASASGTDRPSPRATASVPTKVSPAPVVSTAVTSGAGKRTGSPPRAAYRQPFRPSVITTSGTCRSRIWAAACGSAQPVSAAASCSLGTSRSMCVQESGRQRLYGGGREDRPYAPRLRGPRAPPSRRGAAVPAGGAAGRPRRSRRSSPGPSEVTVPLAPGITTIALDPSSSTTMCAVPLGPATVCSSSVSTPACSRFVRSARAVLVGPDRADHHHLASGAGGGDGLVGALAAGDGPELPSGDGLPAPGCPGDVGDQVHVGAAEHRDRCHGRRTSWWVSSARVSKPMESKPDDGGGEPVLERGGPAVGQRVGRARRAGRRASRPSRRWSRCPSRRTPRGRWSG